MSSQYEFVTMLSTLFIASRVRRGLSARQAKDFLLPTAPKAAELHLNSDSSFKLSLNLRGVICEALFTLFLYELWAICLDELSQ